MTCVVLSVTEKFRVDSAALSLPGRQTRKPRRTRVVRMAYPGLHGRSRRLADEPELAWRRH